jgi:hypothetical protein
MLTFTAEGAVQSLLAGRAFFLGHWWGCLYVTCGKLLAVLMITNKKMALSGVESACAARKSRKISTQFQGRLEIT